MSRLSQRDETATCWTALLGDQSAQDLIEQAHKDAVRIREGRETSEDFQ